MARVLERDRRDGGALPRAAGRALHRLDDARAKAIARGVRQAARARRAADDWRYERVLSLAFGCEGPHATLDGRAAAFRSLWRHAAKPEGLCQLAVSTDWRSATR